MEIVQRIPRTSLARKTHQVLQVVQRGQTVVIENHGQPEAAIIDITDYQLLRAALNFHTTLPEIDVDAGLSEDEVERLSSTQDKTNSVVAHYLAGSISLARAAELLVLPWLELRDRFARLDIPLRFGPATIEEALTDVQNAVKYVAS